MNLLTQVLRTMLGASQLQKSGFIMALRILRWVSVPIVAVAGVWISLWVSMEILMACFHIGARPAGLCSDWWYSNHEWISFATYGLSQFFCTVLLPTLAAPSNKFVIGMAALTFSITLVVINVSLAEAMIVIAILLGASAVAGVQFYRRRQVSGNGRSEIRKVPVSKWPNTLTGRSSRILSI